MEHLGIIWNMIRFFMGFCWTLIKKDSDDLMETAGSCSEPSVEQQKSGFWL